MDGDGDVGVEEALHIKRACKKGRLGEVLVLREGQEGTVEVPVRNKDDRVPTRVGTKREDTGYGSLGSRKCAVMASAETSFDACSVHEGEEGNDKVVGVRDRVDVYGRMV